MKNNCLECHFVAFLCTLLNFKDFDHQLSDTLLKDLSVYQACKSDKFELSRRLLSVVEKETIMMTLFAFQLPCTLCNTL